MKSVIVILVCLVAGIGLGWYFGYTKPTAKTDRYLLQQMHQVESEQALAAVEAIHAVQMIDSGETQKAIRVLSWQISRYYLAYTFHPGTNEEVLKIRGLIDQLAKTNQIVANQLQDDYARYTNTWHETP